MTWEGSQAKRVCDTCFGGDIEAMRFHAERFLRGETVPPLGVTFRSIVLNQNRHQWWSRAVEALPPSRQSAAAKVGLIVTNMAGELDRSRNSKYIEKVLEYIFLAELLKDACLRRQQPVKVLRPEVDDDGFDVVLSCNGVTRHVQLKSSKSDGKTAYVKVARHLAKAESGCVVWMRVTRELGLSYLFFGGASGQTFPDMRRYKIARHSKGNSQGIKSERPNIVEVPKRDFTEYPDIAQLSDVLFGGRVHGKN